MNLLVSGMNQRDAAALEFFLRRDRPDWDFSFVAADQAAAWPASHAAIVDLAAHGWAQASAEHVAQLQARLGDRAALLLSSAQDVSWAELRGRMQAPRWVWLAKPYNAQAMREALDDLAQAVQLPVGVSDKKSLPTRAGPAPTAINVEAKREPPTAPAPSPTDAPDLGCSVLLAQLARTAPDTHRLLQHVARACAQRTPIELRFTLSHCLVIQPLQGWVASNTPAAVVLQVARSDTLARSISVRELSAADCEARVIQLGLPRQPLAQWLQPLLPTLTTSWDCPPYPV